MPLDLKINSMLEPCTHIAWYLIEWDTNIYTNHIPSYIVAYQITWRSPEKTLYRHKKMVKKYNKELC